MTTPLPQAAALPDAATFLAGKDGIIPLQHSAASLQQFAAGFDEAALKPKGAERIAELGHYMADPEWAKAHDAASQALASACQRVEGVSEFATVEDQVLGLWRSRGPNASSVDAIKHPELQTLLQPLKAYLEKFGGIVQSWARLSPSALRPGEEEAMTPNHFRLNNPPPGAHGIGCTHTSSEWLPKAPKVKSPMTPVWWGLGIGAVAITGYAISRYGKKADTPSREAPVTTIDKSFLQHAEPVAASQPPLQK